MQPLYYHVSADLYAEGNTTGHGIIFSMPRAPHAGGITVKWVRGADCNCVIYIVYGDIYMYPVRFGAAYF